MNNDSFMNSTHNKENILCNTADQFHLPAKAKVSKEQMILMRKTNARQVQEIAFEKQQEIEELKSQFQQQKQQLIKKYEKTIEEKDAYIKELEEICAGISGNAKMNGSKREIEELSVFKIEDQCKNYSVPNGLFFHQAPVYDDICYSIERPTLNKTQKIGDFLNTRSVKSRLMSGGKMSRGENMKRSGSSSRHKLVPAPQPSFKKIL